MITKPKDQWPDFLNSTILNIINEKLKFTKMTPVQSVVVPIFTQQHKDLVVEAITGSGKTLSFVVPILEILLKKNLNEKFKKHDIGALIIAPTRELAQQTYDVINIFLNDLKIFTSLLLVGGNSISEDLKNFEQNGANIIVGTVGRLEDLLTRQNSALLKRHLKSLEVLILDEADRLLDMGFKESLESIFKYLPKQRKTGLFSATQTNEMDKLIRAGLRNPCNIQVKQKANVQKTPVALKNYFTIVKPEDKFHLLIEFLNSKKNQKHLIFMNSCASVQYFSCLLKIFLNKKILALHRKIKDKRTIVLNEFKKLDNGILVCTDILSRGIDIEDVDWVVQYDPPNTTNSFVHRCGRTARSNREGNAIVFLLPNEDTFVNFILLNQQVPLQKYDSFNEDLKINSELTINKIHLLASKERELYEKGKIAFVSFIRAYTKHECSHIFQVKELDLVNLGKGFGLLHMPKMPEMKRIDNFKTLPPFYQIDISKIPYKDKSKEKLRLENINKPKLKKFKSDTNKPWSNNMEKKLKKKIKEKKKDLNEKKRKNNQLSEEDFKELEEDFRLLKKFKKSKSSEDDILSE